MKILLVDDDRFVRMAFAMVLRDMEVEVSCAVHGEDAFRILAEEKVDLILCDINMPVMDGLEFGRLLREDLHLADIPLAFITGCRTHELEAEMGKLGVNEVLWKPVGLEQIRAVVKKYQKIEMAS